MNCRRPIPELKAFLQVSGEMRSRHQSAQKPVRAVIANRAREQWIQNTAGTDQHEFSVDPGGLRADLSAVLASLIGTSTTYAPAMQGVYEPVKPKRTRCCGILSVSSLSSSQIVFNGIRRVWLSIPSCTLRPPPTSSREKNVRCFNVADESPLNKARCDGNPEYLRPYYVSVLAL